MALKESPRSIGGDGFRAWIDKLYQQRVETHARPEDVSFRHISEPLPAAEVLRILAMVLGVDIEAFKRRRHGCALRAIAARYLIRYAGQSQRDVADYLNVYFGKGRRSFLLVNRSCRVASILAHKMACKTREEYRMSNVNRVFLLGNLTRDPDLRQTASGMSVSDLGVAVSETYQNKAGETVETTCFADVVVWGKQAEACSQYLAKGAPVMVEGRLQLDQWETDSGEKRSRLRVKADRVQFLGRLRGSGETGGSGQPENIAQETAAGIPF